MRKWIRTGGLAALYLCVAFVLFIVAMHWVYAIHDKNTPPVSPTASGNEAADGKNPVSAEEFVAPHTENISVSDVTYSVYHQGGHGETGPARLPVLMYHHIDPEPDQFPAGTVTPKRFEEDMLYLKALGYETVDTTDLADHLDGIKPLPAKAIMVTFDDGYRSVYERAFPILRELQLKAVVSVIGSSVGRSTHLFEGSPIIPHFSWTEARRMTASGYIDIQSHSFDLHREGDGKNAARGAGRLDGESLRDYMDRFSDDVRDNEQYIEENLHNRVVLYSYPFGIYNETTEKVLKDMGYLASLTIEEGIADISEDFYAMKRFDMSARPSSGEAFEQLAELEGRVFEPLPVGEGDQNERIRALREMLQSASSR